MVLPLLAALLCSQPIDLTFVRHGETQANASGHYNARTLNQFSAKGEKQVAALTEWLRKQRRYDLILVSPSPRALKTVAPYLRETHQKAVVWPLLYECCTGHRNATAPTKLEWGPKLTIPADLQDCFIVRPSMDRLPNSPDWGRGLAQVQGSVRQFAALCSGKRVLLVGHSGHGGQFLHSLDGKWRKLENAKPVELTVGG